MSWLIRVAVAVCEVLKLPKGRNAASSNGGLTVPVTWTLLVGVPPEVNR